MSPRAGRVINREPPPHGTRSRYIGRKWKCRCNACWLAQRDYQREWRAKRGMASNTEEEEKPLDWHSPSVYARFGLAYELLGPTDEVYSAKLDRLARTEPWDDEQLSAGVCG